MVGDKYVDSAGTAYSPVLSQNMSSHTPHSSLKTIGHRIPQWVLIDRDICRHKIYDNFVYVEPDVACYKDNCVFLTVLDLSIPST